MLLSRLFAIASILITTTYALPTPVVRARGADGRKYLTRRAGKQVDVVAVLTQLKTDTAAVVQHINAVVQAGTINETTVAPVIDELTTVINAATARLNQGRPSSNVTPGALALAADIFTNLGQVVGPLTTAPDLRDSLLEILTLNHETTDNWILGVDVILPGFSPLVTPLLESLHQLTLGALGL